jgi:hypothetical protein
MLTRITFVLLLTSLIGVQVNAQQTQIAFEATAISPLLNW